jgi:hypothetical protein
LMERPWGRSPGYLLRLRLRHYEGCAIFLRSLNALSQKNFSPKWRFPKQHLGLNKPNLRVVRGTDIVQLWLLSGDSRSFRST